MELPRHAALAVAASALVAAAVFAPTVGFDFIWDDFRTQRDALPALTHLGSLFLPPRDVSDFGLYYRPLTYGLYWILWAGGAGPGPYHLVAVLLHAGCAGLVAWLALRLSSGSGRAAAALAAGLLFATHPVHVESVAWVGAMGEILGAACLLVALLAYDAARRGGGARPYVAALVFTLLALLSKETLLPAPLLVAALELGPSTAERRRRDAALARVAGLMLPLAAYLVLRRLALGAWILAGSAAETEVRPLSSIAAALLYYVRILLAPSAPCFFVDRLPPLGWTGVAGLLAILAAGALALSDWRRRFLLAYGVTWSLVALAPALAVAARAVAATPVAERYDYVPSIGLALAVAGIVAADRTRWSRLAVAAIVAVGAWTSVARLAPFAKDEAFWIAAEPCAPENCLPALKVADARLAAGDLAGALERYGRLLGLQCSDDQRGMALAHRGVAFYRRGELAEAEAALRPAATLTPWYSVPPYMLARIAVARAEASARRGDAGAQGRELEAAAVEIERALALRPADPEYLYVGGQLAFFRGDAELARSRLREALRLAPGHESAATARRILGQD